MQLHIFEPRYREMVNHCLTTGVPFGIVLIRTGDEVGGPAEPYLVGTKVRIIETHLYDDGRYDLSIEGVERFRIRNIHSEKSYLEGEIESVEELAELDQEYLGRLTDEARGLGEQLIREHVDSGEFGIRVLFPEDSFQLSFALANMLDFTPIRKQFFLELTETSVRLEAIVEVLNELVRQISAPMRRLTSQDLTDWISPN